MTGYRGSVQVAQLTRSAGDSPGLGNGDFVQLALCVLPGLFWYLIFVPFKIGLAGIVFYRLADLLARRWHLRAEGKDDAYTRYARKMMGWINFARAFCGGGFLPWWEF